MQLPARYAYLWALVLILGLHALQPYYGFPHGDDYAYGPLTELWLNPHLFPRDQQIGMYVNHAWTYALAYLAAKETLGLSAGFWLFTAVLAVASGLALFSIMRRLGGEVSGFVMALVLVGLLTVQGIGRADYGGYIAGFFHHQGLALCLVAWSFAIFLGGRNGWAGVLLGLAAYAQPVTALHGALALGVAVIATGPQFLRRGLLVAGIAMATALPLAVLFLNSAIVARAPELAVPGHELIEKAYIFRASHHYLIDGPDILLGWAWIAVGLLSSANLWTRPAARIVAAFIAGLALFHLATTLGHHLWRPLFLPLYVLDVTRSSSLLFAISATAFVAACQNHWHGDGRRSPWTQAAFWLAAILVFAILARYGGPIPWLLAAASFSFVALPRIGRMGTAILAGLAMAVFAIAAPARIGPAKLPEPVAQFYAWVNENTSKDALFIGPPAMNGFRHYTQRSLYADFKMFSVAQPDQAWLTRQRLEQIAQPDAQALKETGWAGAWAWDRSYAENADCKGIAKLLEETGADYLIRQAGGEDSVARAPHCGETVTELFRNEAYSIYRLAGER